MLRLKNGRSEIVIEGSEKGGGWYEFAVTISGKPKPLKKIQGKAAANQYLTEGLEWAFTNGYRMVDERGRAVRATVGGVLEPRLKGREWVVRLNDTLVATMAEGIAQGANPNGVARVIEEVRGEPMRPIEWQAICTCAISIAQRAPIEGVNNRWAVVPSIDKALLSRLVPA